MSGVGSGWGVVRISFEDNGLHLAGVRRRFRRPGFAGIKQGNQRSSGGKVVK